MFEIAAVINLRMVKLGLLIPSRKYIIELKSLKISV